MYLILIAAGAVIAGLLLWPKIRNILPAAWSGTVTGAIGTASDYVSDVAADAALQSLVLLAWANGDMAMIELCADIRTLIKSWNSPPSPATPTIAGLAAELAALRAVVASDTTATIPVAATVKP